MYLFTGSYKYVVGVAGLVVALFLQTPYSCQAGSSSNLGDPTQQSKCPICGRYSKRVHAYYFRTISDHFN